MQTNTVTNRETLTVYADGKASSNVDAVCRAGDALAGGGASLGQPGVIDASASQGNYWRLRARSTGLTPGTQAFFDVYAICIERRARRARPRG